MKKILICILFLPLSLLGQNDAFWFGQLGHNEYVDLLTGLISVYELNETSGTLAADAHDGSNNGAYVNSPSLQQTTVANLMYSVEFDGASQYVDLGDVMFLDGLTKLSVSFWINITSVASLEDGAVFIAKWGGSGVRTIKIGQEADGGNADKLSFSVSEDGSDSTSWATTAGTLNTGSMMHIVITWDGSTETAKAYINSSEVTFTPSGGVPVSSLFNNSTAYLSFMAQHDGSTASEHAGGFQDQVAFYNIVLTQEQVDRLYHYGDGTPYVNF